MLVFEGRMGGRGTVGWVGFMGLRVMVMVGELVSLEVEVDVVDGLGFGRWGCGAGSLGRMDWVG